LLFTHSLFRQHNAFTPELREERIEYRLWAATIARTRLCFIDEVGFIRCIFFVFFVFFLFIFFSIIFRLPLKELHLTVAMHAVIRAVR